DVSRFPAKDSRRLLSLRCLRCQFDAPVVSRQRLLTSLQDAELILARLSGSPRLHAPRSGSRQTALYFEPGIAGEFFAQRLFDGLQPFVALWRLRAQRLHALCQQQLGLVGAAETDHLRTRGTLRNQPGELPSRIKQRLVALCRGALSLPTQLFGQKKLRDR